ncbi:MAG: DUF1318 domain-containing protein [Candidatus Abyssobacteria bacterium SURF_5]|uniref:DUF1318 domain-containing protein n=1 Tax=Abyssobacteria bacterium (strain SURF_5) TaxID=2093360 RepID=A0A3A4PBQ2_ABYX5|nr:MAG: DUF1318 domain-containing protein [Candidatus Abyssubacteria bacterium SURF_5]
MNDENLKKGGNNMKHSLRLIVFLAVVLTLACVTVNVYFPAAEVQQAADRIVEDVYRDVPPSPQTAPPEQSMLRREFRRLFFQNQAFAQADINITTPNIRALRASLEKRFEELAPFYEKGAIGIGNNGLLSIRSLEGLSLQEKAEVNKLVKADNADRENLYSEIAKANELGPENVPEIRRLFANSWREKARKGWIIQNDKGEWVTKN